jgi:hypothetical protein
VAGLLTAVTLGSKYSVQLAPVLQFFGRIRLYCVFVYVYIYIYIYRAY